ncbi:MAG TPA: type II toxin-antitoxin system ParD family antitoxin [Caulobacteraceae bacterium]|jgi:antitoxin ParD1/3/4
MTKVTKISVALPAEMAAMVNQAVESGDYATGSEVIREALREWKQRRHPVDHRLLELWNEGVASGPGRFPDMADIKAEARRRLQTR